MSVRPGRIVGIAIGAVAILGIGVYGPSMLLGPLPAAAVTTTGDDASALPEAVQVPLPAAGQSAIAVISDAPEGDEADAAKVVAEQGDGTPVPIGGAAKLVTILVTLDSLPLAPGEPGPSIPIQAADYTDYLAYRDADSRSLQVSPGESWSERDVVRAVLFASSNNHADTLARWAFGSVDAYVTAANGWLAEQGFTATRVADATGLSGDNVGTASEVARLTALAAVIPSLAGMLDGSETPPSGSRQVPDVVDRPGERDVRALVRSFTEQAALTFLFTSPITGADGTRAGTLAGAMLLMPDYETLDPAVTAVVDAAASASAPVELIAEGASYGRVTTAWGDDADLIAQTGRTGAGWATITGEPQVTVDEITTASASRDVGRVAVTTADGEVGSPLRLSADIDDPGPLWRLTNPLAIIQAFLAD